jgi:hypothetical protein
MAGRSGGTADRKDRKLNVTTAADINNLMTVTVIGSRRQRLPLSRPVISGN